MAPLVPRVHFYEIDDQTWFPSFLRARVQDALTVAWTIKVPLIESGSPADLAASILTKRLGDSLSSYTFIDFCSGGGGPTPFIEKAVNEHLREGGQKPVNFVLTDLFPNVAAWKPLAEQNEFISYEAEPVDATNAPEQLVKRPAGKKTMRLFNLAFHHFDDPLAKAILKNTVETSDGFAIFELQDRSFASAVTLLMMGIGIMVLAPYYAIKWRSFTAIFFSWVIPIIPFVLVFDGYVSALRTRTPDEVEALLRDCGADSSKWEISSSRDRFVWPCGYLSWIVCKPREE